MAFIITAFVYCFSIYATFSLMSDMFRDYEDFSYEEDEDEDEDED